MSPDFSLYLVTDRGWTGEKSLAEQVELAILGGVTILQLREKNLTDAEFLREAYIIGEMAARYRVPFIINDNVGVAKACNADGLHIGQGDMALGAAREELGAGKVIGVSVGNLEQAMQAEKDGADYLGVGAVFPTGTKTDAEAVSAEELRRICGAVSVPVVAIGGINENNIDLLKGSGIAGAAVISAILSSPDIRGAAGRLKAKLRTICKGCRL